jgi:signal transduction histidine kinase
VCTAMTKRFDEIGEINRAFLSHISHELKGPLASIRETIQLLAEEVPGPLNEKQKKLLNLSLECESRLGGIIRNLLDVSRIDTGTMDYDPKPQNLTALLRKSVAQLQPKADQKQVQIKLEVPVDEFTVDCDGERVAQVVENLVGNAIKFSPASGTVAVRLRLVADAQQGSISPTVLIEVADSGPGIPDDQKEGIFDRYYQARQGKKGKGQGAGLGLAISRSIAQAHSGALWVEDNPHGGSLFKLLIPLNTGAAHR